MSYVIFTRFHPLSIIIYTTDTGSRAEVHKSSIFNFRISYDLDIKTQSICQIPRLHPTIHCASCFAPAASSFASSFLAYYKRECESVSGYYKGEIFSCSFSELEESTAREVPKSASPTHWPSFLFSVWWITSTPLSQPGTFWDRPARTRRSRLTMPYAPFPTSRPWWQAIRRSCGSTIRRRSLASRASQFRSWC